MESKLGVHETGNTAEGQTVKVVACKTETYAQKYCVLKCAHNLKTSENKFKLDIFGNMTKLLYEKVL